MSNNSNLYQNYGVWNDMPSELYIIGDIHGDFFALKQSLELTNCIYFDDYNDKLNLNEEKYYYYLDDGCKYYSVDKNNVKWNYKKKNCFIIFSGDLIDRCRPHNIVNKECINTVSDENCDYLLLKLLYDLDIDAQKYNSRVIVVLGNHEILNLQNDFTYVSLKGRNDNLRNKNIIDYLKLNLSNIYGIIRINKYIIVHGGINDQFFIKFNNSKKNDIFESIELFNCELREFILTGKSLLSNTNFDHSPFWDRTLGGRDYFNNNQCNEIFDNNLLKIKNFDNIKNNIKIIVAHCPQFVVNQIINLVDCQEHKNKIYRIDIGMSRAFDFYDINKIKNILDTNSESILNMNYKDFFIINEQTSNRIVSCLKLTETNETILKGTLTIDYFYNLKIFNNYKLKLIHIISDIIKIFIDTFNKNNNPPEQIKYIHNIKKLQTLLLRLSKQ